MSFGIADGAKLLAKICAVLLLGAVWKAAESGTSPLSLAFRAVTILSLTLILQNALSSTLKVAFDTMNATNTFLLASLPVSGMLLVMKGQVQRATLQGVSLQHVIAVFSVITSKILAPTLRFLMALTLAGSLGGDASSLTGYVAKFLKRSFVFLFTILSAILTLQNALCGAADSVAMRGVRFAAGSFIPVVGNLVGESARTLAAGLDLVSKECGVFCVVILVYLLGRPLLLLAVQKAVLSLAGAASELLGDKECAAFLKGVCVVWDLLLAVMAFQGCYFLFSVFLFLGGGSS